MQRLIGDYEVKVDAKGRFRLPSQLIRQLGDLDSNHFVVNRGFEKHLSLYPRSVWDTLVAKLDKKLSMFKEKQRKFMRYFNRGATELTLDSSDRLLLPKGLIEYAGIEKDMVLSTLTDRIEIWSKAEYEKMIQEEPEDMSEFTDMMADDIDIDI